MTNYFGYITDKNREEGDTKDTNLWHTILLVEVLDQCGHRNDEEEYWLMPPQTQFMNNLCNVHRFPYNQAVS